MAQAPPPRILLCGDVLGRLHQLFKRVHSVNKSAGPFDALLCAGQFFPDSPDQLDEFMAYVQGDSDVPIPTYFIGDYGVGAAKVLLDAARHPGNQGFKMDGLRVCDNLYWLKGSGKFLLRGLSVVYLSGKKPSSGQQQYGAYSQDDVDALHAIAEEPGVVDLLLTYPSYSLSCPSFTCISFLFLVLPLFFLHILLIFDSLTSQTNEWPSNVTNRAAPDAIPPELSHDLDGDSTVAELAAEIKPRYHIAGSKVVFYSREPYSNDGAVHVTRFIGLAPVGNKDKQKFIHAISPTPASTMSTAEISAKPMNTTLSPYTDVDTAANSKESAKRPLDDALETQYWRYEVKKQKQGDGDRDKLCFKFLSSSCPRGEKCRFRHDPDAREQYLRGACFDFLNKGACERGPECKFEHKLLDGPRSSRSEGGSVSRSKDCWFCLSNTNVESHLIASIGEHFYCALAKGPLVDDHMLITPIEHFPSTLSLPPVCGSELHKFQSSLRMYSKNQGKETVFFELISKRGTHANLQAIPVPLAKASSLKNIFTFAAKKLGFEFEVIRADDGSDRKTLAKLHSESKYGFFYVELPDHTILSHSMVEHENFPVQFGREVLSGLLKMPNKADWRDCKLSKDEELKLVAGFKTHFAGFDLEQHS